MEWIGTAGLSLVLLLQQVGASADGCGGGG